MFVVEGSKVDFDWLPVQYERATFQIWDIFVM